MFLVMNKEKLYAYLVSIVTVILLFCIATTINSNQESIVIWKSKVITNI